MKTKVITVLKRDVYDEVCKTSDYIGVKLKEDDGYQRVGTVDEDRQMFERFWIETATLLANELIKHTLSINYQTTSQGLQIGSDFSMTLSLSERTKDNIDTAINGATFGYFVNSIASKWLMITHREDAKDYAHSALTELKNIKEIVFQKEPPRRR